MSNWLQKLGFGLKKSSTKLTTGLSDIFNKRKIDAETLDELEELLISSDIGIAAANRIIRELSKARIGKESGPEEVKECLADIIDAILKPCEKEFILSASPTVILMVGVNGAGKTTTIGKLISRLKKDHRLQCSIIAADTFRAAAVEQLQIWGERNQVRVFKGAPGCDAAGLCYDGLQEALKLKDNVVFIDTAGRLQNKTGLMEELRKVVRVIKKVLPEAPHHTLLCLDATTGQNALEQVKTFKEMVEVNGLIINKLDGTAKGGILIAMAQESPTPVYFIGVGEGIEDMDIFNAADFTSQLLDI